MGAEGAIPGESTPAPEAVVPAQMSPLAHLLTSHLIPDHEVVILLIKPSLLFIPLSSMMTLGVSAVIALSGILFIDYLPGASSSYVNLGILLAVSRLMWATLQWMGRYYILTDLRLMSLSGVFHTNVFQCPLRRVARVRLLRNFRERLLFLGNMEIIPQDDQMPVGIWQTLSEPTEILERVQRAIAKAKSTGRGA